MSGCSSELYKVASVSKGLGNFQLLLSKFAISSYRLCVRKQEAAEFLDIPETREVIESTLPHCSSLETVGRGIDVLTLEQNLGTEGKEERIPPPLPCSALNYVPRCRSYKLSEHFQGW